MSDISIVIPTRGNPLGLWATIHSCFQDLEASRLDAKFIVVANGDEQLPIDLEKCLTYLDRSGALQCYIHSPEPLAPPVARQRGAAKAEGKYLFFFDNHCIVARQFFERALLDLEKYEADMLHSSYIFYAKDQISYEYRLKLDYNFWGESQTVPYSSYKPYMIGAGGHGGFVVRKSAWSEVGGYGPEELFNGYGGEEVLFDFKMWRLGKTNYIDPKLIHYHYTGVRGYDRHFTDTYYTNLLVSANVIGGEKWLYKVFDSLLNKPHLRMNPKKHWHDILETAYYRSAAYSKELDAKSKMSLDELLVYFREHEVRT